MRSMVEGASDSKFHFRRRRIVKARAPSTAQTRGPPPRFAGQDVHALHPAFSFRAFLKSALILVCQPAPVLR